MQQGARLELSQRHELTITPQMQQAIAILLMSALELEVHVEEELKNNPVLELEEVEASREETSDAEPQKSEAPAEDDYAPSADEEPRQSPEESAIDEVDYANLFSSEAPREYSGDSEEYTRSVERAAPETVVLADYLSDQLRTSGASTEVEKTATILISQLDPDGYLPTPLDEIERAFALDGAVLAEAHRLLRTFDPAGICAADLRDCLLLQLERLGKEQTLEWRIVSNHIDDLSKNRIPNIASALDAEIAEVYEALDFIKTLEPRPGRSFGASDTNYIVPDVIVEKIDGEYVVSLRNDRIPSLRVSNYYLKMYEQEKRKKGEIGEYLKSKLDSAVWLIRSIEQRQKTIYRVSESIVRQQRDFFEYGPKYLKPMTLRVVAEEIGVHESTVSRVTTNKYMQTPRGTFELKYFFSSPIETSAGEDASSRAVKTILAEIIANEDPTNPVSDQKLSEMMKSRGFTIARRTVTKYRETLNIPSAKQRMRFS